MDNSTIIGQFFVHFFKNNKSSLNKNVEEQNQFQLHKIYRHKKTKHSTPSMNELPNKSFTTTLSYNLSVTYHPPSK